MGTQTEMLTEVGTKRAPSKCPFAPFNIEHLLIQELEAIRFLAVTVAMGTVVSASAPRRQGCGFKSPYLQALGNTQTKDHLIASKVEI